MRPIILAVAVATVVVTACSSTPATNGGSPSPAVSSSSSLVALPTLTVQATVKTAKPFDLVQAFGSLWIENNGAGTVSRVDPATNTVIAEVPVSTFASSITVAPDGLWTIDGDAGAVAFIDPAVNKVTKRWPIEGGDGGGLEYANGLLWHNADRDTTTLVSLDPATGKQVDHPVPDGCRGTFIIEASTAYLAGSGSICKADVWTFKVVGTYKGDVQADRILGESSGHLWSVTSSGDPVLIDAATMTLVATIPQGPGGMYQGSAWTLGITGENAGVASNATGVWIRLSATTIGRVTLGTPPTFVLYAGLPASDFDGTPIIEAFGSLWVTSARSTTRFALP